MIETWDKKIIEAWGKAPRDRTWIENHLVVLLMTSLVEKGHALELFSVMAANAIRGK